MTTLRVLLRPIIGVVLLFVPLSAAAQPEAVSVGIPGVWERAHIGSSAEHLILRSDGTGALDLVGVDHDLPERPFDWSVFSTADGPDGRELLVLRIDDERRGALYLLASLEGPDQLRTSARWEDAVPIGFDETLTYERVKAFAPALIDEREPSLHDRHEAAFLGTWEGEIDEGRLRITFLEGRRATMGIGDAQLPIHWSLAAESVIDQTDVLLVDLHMAGTLAISAAVFDGPDRLLMTEGRRRTPTRLSRQVELSRVDGASLAAEAEAAARYDAWCRAAADACALLRDAVAGAASIDRDGPRAVAFAGVARHLVALGQDGEARRLIAEALGRGREALIGSGGLEELAAIGGAQALAGLTADAEATFALVREIADTDVGMPLAGLFIVAAAQRSAGLIEQAEQTFAEGLSRVDQAVEDHLVQMQVLNGAQRLAQLGMVAEAAELAQRITDDWRRERVMIDLASAQAAAGQIDEARQTADEGVDEDIGRQMVDAAIAAALARTGRTAEAEAWVAALGDSPFTAAQAAPVLRAIAEFEAGEGRIDEARAAAERIEPVSADRAAALGAVAAAVAASGQHDAWRADLAAALAAAEDAPPFDRLEALITVGTSLAEAGMADAARQLFADADALLEAGGPATREDNGAELAAAMAAAAVALAEAP